MYYKFCLPQKRRGNKKRKEETNKKQIVKRQILIQS